MYVVLLPTLLIDSMTQARRSANVFSEAILVVGLVGELWRPFFTNILSLKLPRVDNLNLSSLKRIGIARGDLHYYFSRLRNFHPNQVTRRHAWGMVLRVAAVVIV